MTDPTLVSAVRKLAEALDCLARYFDLSHDFGPAGEVARECRSVCAALDKVSVEVLNCPCCGEKFPEGMRGFVDGVKGDNPLGDAPTPQKW